MRNKSLQFSHIFPQQWKFKESVISGASHNPTPPSVILKQQEKFREMDVILGILTNASVILHIPSSVTLKLL